MKLSQLQILEYALEGVHVRLGTHPAPDDYLDEIRELEAHQAELKRRIKQRKAKEKSNDQPT